MVINTSVRSAAENYVAHINCSRCGRDTEWDFSIGDLPLCRRCWDIVCDRYDPEAASQRKYREEHQAERAASHRKYREEHQAERAAK